MLIDPNCSCVCDYNSFGCLSPLSRFRMGVLNSYVLWSRPPCAVAPADVKFGKKKVYLRTVKALRKKTIETCLKVNNEHSVMLCFPQSLTDARQMKYEVYEGFRMSIVMNCLMLLSKR
ncbi:hypothetical protein Hanom_Chr03g00227681 [Helianthus anomalus]